MNLLIKEIEFFKKIFESIKELDIVDTNFEFSENGILIENMDASHTSLVYLLLSKTFFESYVCKRKMTVGLNIPVFCKILKACRENDEIIISKKEKDNFLSIIISNNDKKQEFELPEMDIDNDKLSVIDNHTYKMKMSSNIFCRIIHDISLVEGNNVKIQLLPSNKLMWTSEGDLGKTSLESTINDINFNEVDTRLFNSYSINFMKKFIKSSHLGLEGDISIAIDNDMPIKLSSDLGNKSELKFYIAPKID